MKEGFPNGGKVESKESQEAFRGTMSFDFIFSADAEGHKKIYCIEINGEESGISGIRDIPPTELDHQQKLLADIRATNDPEFERKSKIGSEIAQSMRDGTFQTSDKKVKREIYTYVRESLERERMFAHAFNNPHAIEEVTVNKRLQQRFIPEEYRPHIYVEGSGKTPASASGFWVLKPVGGLGGKGVRIVTNEVLEALLEEKEEWLKPWVIQEFIPPTGAERAPEDMKNHAASLRLLIDFIYRVDGTIDPIYQAAYQRVSSFDSAERIGKMDMESAFVVNKSLGAKSVPASDSEISLAREAAYSIIKNIGKAYVNGTLLEE